MLTTVLLPVARSALRGRLPAASLAAVTLVVGLGAAAPAGAQVDLADRPPRTTQSVPANVLLALSVEWPTGNVQAYNDERVNGCAGRDGGFSVCYFDPPARAAAANAANAANPRWRARASMPYLGYFDPFKCYRFDAGLTYFVPVGYTAGFDPTKRVEQQPATALAKCSGAWSGNFLNWSTMQTIDLFRWAMTGGDRWADTTTLTVLEKARHDGQGGTGQFPDKRVNGVGGPRPSEVADLAQLAARTGVAVRDDTWNALYIRVADKGTSMWVSNTADFAKRYEIPVRVEVCNKDFPETATPCTRYAPGLEDADPSNDALVDPTKVVLKPTGLIQENAMAVRFSAFGYLLDDSKLRDGGVMRARMKFVGPTQPTRTGAGRMANTATEWDPVTGIFLRNPDKPDADATNSSFGLAGADAVTQSGVVQYLNQFGRKYGYKNHDPVSEMYYEALRYFRNLAPTREYTTMADTPGTAARKVDGFPVITAWDDPLAPPAGFAGPGLAEWCPKNFIIGIADSNTHKDKRLPGNTATDDADVAAQPSDPDTTINVTTTLNDLIATELANEGVRLRRSDGSTLGAGTANCCQGSAYLSALAYHAHTRDLRADGAAIQSLGNQTVQTFYVDVRESGSWGTGVSRTDERRRNQLWLAAKYGGFHDANGNGRLDRGDATNDNNGDGRIDVRDAWDKDGDWLPDGYYEASTPEALVEGLRNAFATIRASVASAVGVGVSTKSIELTTDTGLYRVSFDPRSWAGSLVGYRYVGFDAASGSINTSKAWDLAEKLPLQHWSTGRRIVTMRSDGRATAGTNAVALRWDQLSTAQQAALGDDPTLLDWLRGAPDTGSRRTRVRYDERGNVYPALLGDIVDSEPRYVGAPQAPYVDQYNPGYSAFKTARANRRGVIYAGANDGMLHAVDADVEGTGTGGTELFAYVPSFLFFGPTAPTIDGLAALADPGYSHRYYVNASPTVADVDFGRTGGRHETADWRTVLVSGLGKGGRGFFAIDVTDPSAFASEGGAAGKVLWEFTDPDMGFSLGLPQVAKTARWGWVVLLTSGYNNTPRDGMGGWLYVLDVKTGALLQKIGVPGTGAVGLAQVTAYAPDSTDGAITEVYGGDNNGDVWRFDFNSATAAVPPPVRFAQLRDSTGRGQPISTGPIVRVAPLTRNRYVFVGTGRVLGSSDVYSDLPQSFYALRDGTRAKAWAPGALPTPIDFPLDRAKLVRNADLLSPIARDPARPGGWFFDLPALGERVIVDPADTDFGKISWLGTIPDANNPCSPTGGSRIYAANFETGQSQLFDPASLLAGPRARVQSLDPKTGAVGLRLVRVDGNIRAVVTGQYNELRLTQGYFRYLGPRSLNWREVLEPGS